MATSSGIRKCLGGPFLIASQSTTMEVNRNRRMEDGRNGNFRKSNLIFEYPVLLHVTLGKFK